MCSARNQSASHDAVMTLFTPRTFLNWSLDRQQQSIMHRLGPGRRATHLEVQTSRVQQLAKVGLISLNKLKTQGNVADLLTKQVPRAVLDKLVGMMGYIPWWRKCKASCVHKHQPKLLDQKVAEVEELPIFDDEEKRTREICSQLWGRNDSSHDSRFEAACWDVDAVMTLFTPTTVTSWDVDNSDPSFLWHVSVEVGLSRSLTEAVRDSSLVFLFVGAAR